MTNRRTFLASALGAAATATFPATPLFGAEPALKLFDTHAHFYTNQPDRYPFHAGGARYGAERMIAKAMANPMTPQVVFEFWDAVGVEMGTGVQYNSTYGTDNSYLLDVAAQYPDRILPVVILSPTAADTPAALQKFAAGNRLAAVRFSGSPDDKGEVPFLSDAARDTWAAADELGIGVVLMPLGANIPLALPKVAAFADRYANVKVVLDHVAFPHPELLPDSFGLTPQHLALAQHANIYYKFTSLLIAEMATNAQAAGKPVVKIKPFLNHMIATFGADHMVWGSDHGNVEVDDIAYVRRALEASEDLSPAQRSALFHDTARSVFIPGGRGRANA
jgi:predicted TIM-barrel fold metal-dependent hydrolase